jgi:hypothetical protein
VSPAEILSVYCSNPLPLPRTWLDKEKKCIYDELKINTVVEQINRYRKR